MRQINPIPEASTVLDSVDYQFCVKLADKINRGREKHKVNMAKIDPLDVEVIIDYLHGWRFCEIVNGEDMSDVEVKQVKKFLDS